MGFFDRINIFDGNWWGGPTNEGDNHVWTDEAGTVCVRLYNGGVTDAQLREMRNLLEQGDNYNVYIGDNDFPDYSKAYEPEGYAGDLIDTVPPYSAPEDVIPPMPFTFLGLKPLYLSLVGGVVYMFFGKKIRKNLGL
jgi:hypothetical protein